MAFELAKSVRLNKCTFYAHDQEYVFAANPLDVLYYIGINNEPQSNSLNCFTKESKVRQFLVRLVTWKYFELFITLMIMANSVLLGIMDYTDTNNETW